MLYNDDGTTYDYEKGKYCPQKLQAGKDASGAMTGKVSMVKDSFGSVYSDIKWHFMSKQGKIDE